LSVEVSFVSFVALVASEQLHPCIIGMRMQLFWYLI